MGQRDCIQDMHEIGQLVVWNLFSREQPQPDARKGYRYTRERLNITEVV